MNGSMCREILEKNIQISATSMGYGQNFICDNGCNLDPPKQSGVKSAVNWVDKSR